MTTTRTLAGLEATLRRWGVPYTADDVVEGRPRGDFLPEALMWHHTAPGGTSTKRMYPSRTVVRDGRDDLEGPLYQLVVTRDPLLDVVTLGRANHAGTGGPAFGLSSGNRSFVGFAFEHLGTAREPWRDDVLELGVLATAAVLDHLHQPATRLLSHVEWTPRKIDPYQLDMDVWRREVARVLHAGPPTATPTEDDMLQIAVYGDRRFVLTGNGKREVTAAAAAELVRADAGRIVSGLSARTLNEFPTYAEDGTVGGSTVTALADADDIPAGGACGTGGA